MANLLTGKAVPPGPTEAAAPEWTLKEMLDFVYREHWSKLGNPDYFKRTIETVVADLGPLYPAIDLLGSEGYEKIVSVSEARGNSGGTINRKTSLISKALKVSIERGKLQGVLKPQFGRKKEGKARERILSREEEAACLAWAQMCSPDFADWFIVGIDTGYRSYSEGLNIYPFVDVRGRDLFIRGRLLEEESNVVDLATARRRTKTGEGKSRVVGLTTRALAVIERRKARLHNSPTTKLFPADLTKWRIMEYWERMRDHLGITDPEFVPYSLRHTFGTRCILAGVNVPDLATLMGHSTIKQTWKYVHLAGLVQTGAATKLDDFLSKG